MATEQAARPTPSDPVLDEALESAALWGGADVSAFVSQSPSALPVGELLQVLDADGTWHAATVGEGVLCGAARRAAGDPVTTVQWDYGTSSVDCPDPACQLVEGRL